MCDVGSWMGMVRRHGKRGGWQRGIKTAPKPMPVGSARETGTWIRGIVLASMVLLRKPSIPATKMLRSKLDFAVWGVPLQREAVIRARGQGGCSTSLQRSRDQPHPQARPGGEIGRNFDCLHCPDLSTNLGRDHLKNPVALPATAFPSRIQHLERITGRIDLL
jgi:hypothetical protein